MSKTDKNKFSLIDVYKKIRQTWTINPRTRIKKSKKRYNRARAKREFKKELENE